MIAGVGFRMQRDQRRRMLGSPRRCARITRGSGHEKAPMQRRSRAARCPPASRRRATRRAARRRTRVPRASRTTTSCPASAVGSRWLASFQQSVPSHEAKSPIASISVTKRTGAGPSGSGNAEPVAALAASSTAGPASASGSVATPCAVAHVRGPGRRARAASRHSGSDTTSSRRRRPAPAARRGRNAPDRRAGARRLEQLRLVDERDAGSDQERGRREAKPGQAAVAARSRQFDAIAITTRSVPITIVGSGPPARWIAAARQQVVEKVADRGELQRFPPIVARQLAQAGASTPSRNGRRSTSASISPKWITARRRRANRIRPDRRLLVVHRHRREDEAARSAHDELRLEPDRAIPPKGSTRRSTRSVTRSASRTSTEPVLRHRLERARGIRIARRAAEQVEEGHDLSQHHRKDRARHGAGLEMGPQLGHALSVRSRLDRQASQVSQGLDAGRRPLGARSHCGRTSSIRAFAPAPRHGIEPLQSKALALAAGAAGELHLSPRPDEGLRNPHVRTFRHRHGDLREGHLGPRADRARQRYQRSAQRVRQGKAQGRPDVVLRVRLRYAKAKGETAVMVW